MIIGSPVIPPDEFTLPGFVSPPRAYVDVRNEYRLISVLCEAAQTKNPTEILARAAERFFFTIQGEGPAVSLGNAYADLAVTGRASYEALKALERTDRNGFLQALKDTTQLKLTGSNPTDARISAAVDHALNRAYAVAWALRGPVARRETLRARLGWIAVSGEDDPPHRPVNVPAPPYEQYEIEVTTPVNPLTTPRRPGPISLSTRFFVASAEPAEADAVPYMPRELPPDPDPALSIPSGHDVILFLHGHSSGAEEALDIIPHLLEEGLKWEKKYSIVSFDLPNNGYSQTFDHKRIAAPNETNYPFLPTDNTPIRTPILDFIEDFVVSFVNALDQVAEVNGAPVVKDRVAAVIGGSLGGNLGLRLGRRKIMPAWLDRAIVAWSPASVWPAMVKNHPRREGPRDTLVEFQKEEVDESRRDYFFITYDKKRALGSIKPQPTYWYGKSFPDANFRVRLSRIARREIYNPFFRQWHWRVACEQLIFSHVENEEYGDSSTPVRYTLNTVRTLLAAGEEDNYYLVGIYDATKFVGTRMVQTPGRLLLVRDTGHSIYAERPGFLASEIMKFLNAKSIEIRCITREEGRITSVGVFDHTDNVESTMTQEKCILAIHRGDDLFVVGPNGDRAAVVIGFRFGPDEGADSDYFIKTEADESESNNLLSLKECSEPEP